MKASRSHCVVLVTCGSRKEAQRIARTVVESRLAACVNILRAPVDSIYRWKGAVESAREFLLVVKTAKSKLRALEARVRELHSYDVPEFIVLPVVGGSRAYLDWLTENVQAIKRKGRQ